MKKLKKLNFKKKPEALPPRITNETVAEHRERILAGGRRFKYPVQYGRRKLVFNTVLISLAAILLTLLFGWWQLYVVQNSSTLAYQATRVLPLPVARVDGHAVRYSDYFMHYRSSIHFSENIDGLDLDNENGQEMKSYFKRRSLDNAITEAYAEKLADELNITVSQEEVDVLLKAHLEVDGQQVSPQAYAAAVDEQYGWSEEEYSRSLERQLLRKKVSVAVDKKAESIKNQLEKELNSDGSNFEEIAKKFEGQVELSAPGRVPNGNTDGGQARAALGLQPGKVSAPFVSRGIDGYYFIKLLDKTDSEVNYISIKVPLTQLNTQLQAIKKDGKIKEYIKVAEVEGQVSTEEE